MADFATSQRSIAILDEGITLTPSATQINFTGAGVAGSVLGRNVTEAISGAPGTISYQEVPSGTIDGNNTVFTLSNAPVSNTLELVLNGAPQQGSGGDFTLSGSTITFVNAPVVSSTLWATYSY